MSAECFPVDFAWGAASSSYQIEGAADADGKGLSVWDTFCREPGKVWEGHTGEVACDHYHRYREDVALMAAMGLKAYRFSISWPRVLPQGTGAVNEAGLDFYDRLVDALLKAGIEPWVTLFHWDYPTALYHQGGWLNPKSADWFAEYSRAVVRRLGNRVKHWITFNEPQCFVGVGHEIGRHAPGLKLSRAETLLAAHHVLLAHGKAVQVIRAECAGPVQVGWAPVGVVTQPETERPEDVEAARQVMFSAANPMGWSVHWNTTWWADPLLKGAYPEDGLRYFGADAPRFTAAEMQTMAQPIDFFGANIYNGQTYRAGADGKPEKVDQPPGFPIHLLEWKVTPGALYWGPRFLYERYGLPIVITENGASCHDWVSLDGKVHDAQRIDFTARYLRELARAMADGVDVRGYMHWSILDNFEWAEGYKHRMGLIHVDFTTQVRTLKESAKWYAEVIRTHGAALWPEGR